MSDTTTREIRVFICTVGGTPDPIITAINEYKPTHAMFVVSPDSVSQVPPLLKRAAWQEIDYRDDIMLSDFQNFLSSVRDIRGDVHKFMEKYRLPENTLILADITGGTKPMAAALALVMTEEFNSRFSYVGGTRRDKDGLGTVMDGYESVLKMENPWEAMGVPGLRKLVYAFNHGQFGAAATEARTLHSKRGSDFYEGLCQAMNAFRLWNAFDYDDALKQIKNAVGRLKHYSEVSPQFKPFFYELKKCRETLENILLDRDSLKKMELPVPPGSGQYFLKDLVANAARCAAVQRYDDAVARLYCAIEKTGKIALASYNLDNSDLDPACLDNLPEDLRAQVESKRESNGKIKIGLSQTFEVLRALFPDDETGIRYGQRKDELSNALSERNKSLLAHGFTSINEKHYQALFNAAMDFLALSQDDLPSFPVLDGNSLPIL